MAAMVDGPGWRRTWRLRAKEDEEDGVEDAPGRGEAEGVLGLAGGGRGRPELEKKGDGLRGESATLATARGARARFLARG
jgi:hypothetical protein